MVEHKPLLLGRVAIRLGLLESPEKFTARVEFEKRRKFERDRNAHMVIRHSTACCTSEMEYLLLLRGDDPHPNHLIEFRPCDCEDRNPDGSKKE